MRLFKTNPDALISGQPANYSLNLVNLGNLATGTALVVYDQLPPNVQYNSVAKTTLNGSTNLTNVFCTVTGAVATGQQLTCILMLPTGGLPVYGQTSFTINVTPQAAGRGGRVVNRAAIDPTGANAVQIPANCTANDQPALGCAVTDPLTIDPPQLGLNKTNPASLTVGSASAYRLALSNTGAGPTGTTLNVYEQLPPNVAYTSVASVAGGTVTPSAAVCNVTSGTVVSGQLLNCVLTLPVGGLPVGGTANFSVSVTPQAAALGSSVVNKAQVDPTGSNAAQTPAACTANGTPAGCAVTSALTVQSASATLRLSKISVGGVGSFTFTGDNGWASQALVTAKAGTPVQGASQTLSSLNTDTTFKEAAPSGWALSAVNCVDGQASQSGNPAGTFAAKLLGAGQWQLPAIYIKAGAALSCTITNSFGGFVVSGQVLVDNGLGNGTAHDGVQNGAEQGQAGVHLNLSDCSGTVYSTGQSDGAGHFSLGTGTAPPGPVCLQQSLPSGYVLVSAQGGTAGAVYNRNSDALVFNLGANTSYSGLLFGNVPVSLFTGEGSQQVQPGQSATYGHIYTAGTSASVSLSSTDTPSVSGQSWNSVVYQDLNCNGQLDATDVVIPATQTLNVVAGQQLCLLVRVFSPANASALSTDRTQLMAMEVFQPNPAIAIGVSIRYQYKEDLSTVSSTGAALVLLKQVRKVGNCPSTAADTLAFAVSNQAAPGDYVEYQLSYSNGSAGPLSRIQIEDAVPAYTSFRSAGCGSNLPTGLQGCSVTQQPVVGGAGSLQWTLKDAVQQPVGLQPGGQGTVVFCVQVQR